MSYMDAKNLHDLGGLCSYSNKIWNNFSKIMILMFSHGLAYHLSINVWQPKRSYTSEFTMIFIENILSLSTSCLEICTHSQCLTNMIN